MSVAAAMVYWVVVALWLTVLCVIVFFYARDPRTFGTARLLLAVLCIDALRNLFENTYFGLYFGSVYGILPANLTPVLGNPALILVPKVLNVIAGSVVLGLLLWRWLPLAIKERGQAEQRASDLETLAAIDFMTGIYNRRHFETLARAELGRCQRYMRPLSLLMIDVDHFKSINDRLGHAAGDRVLQNVAAICMSEKRDADIAARVGGEEFAIMLPETTRAAAVQFAERLRRKVKDSVPTIYGEKIDVTISVGVADASIRTAGMETLMQEADQALYEAKDLGRDRVVAARVGEPGRLQEAAE
jgi:diguanylate cyclase (GGDEF)-like protein